VLVDLNGIADDNDMVVGPLELQAERLVVAYEKIRSQNPDAVVHLICHSQGCLVAGLARLSGVKRTILLAPPSESGTEGIEYLFTFRPESSSLDKDGESTLSRADGSTTTVLPEYWSSLAQVQPLELYLELCESSEVTIVSAENDQILKHVDFSSLKNLAIVQSISGDHNFTEPDRRGLIDTVNALVS